MTKRSEKIYMEITSYSNLPSLGNIPKKWVLECIEQGIKEQLKLYDVSVSLPTKDEVVSKGYEIASNGRYNYRRVLKNQDHDIYYSGWLDCFEFLLKGNER